MNNNIITLTACTLIMFISSCANDTEMRMCEQSFNSSVNSSNIRTICEAIQIAKEAANLRDSTVIAGTRTSTQIVEIRNVEVIKDVNTRTHSIGFNSDTIIYAVNYADNQGFALISANPRTEGLLAVTDSGYYSAGEPCEIEGFKCFVEMAKKYVMELDRLVPDTNLLPDPVVYYDTIYQRRNTVSTFRWGQSDPQGRFCPNGLAGCAAIAVSHVLSTYQYPLSIDLTYSDADEPVQNIDWNLMSFYEHLNPINMGYEQYADLVDRTENSIGRLCRQLGEIMNSTYDTNSTNTSTSELPQCFTTLGYTHSGWHSYTNNCTRNPISNGHPLIIFGQTLNPSGGYSGHFWNVDGYILQIITKYTILPNGLTLDSPISERLYNHVDWGWYGLFNGYFYDGVFDISNSESFDNNGYNYGYIPTTYNFLYNLMYLEAYRP